MGRVKELLMDLFNKKMGDYAECPVEKINKAINDGRLIVNDTEDVKDLIGHYPIVYTPAQNSGTICLPKGTNIADMDAINTRIKDYQTRYVGTVHSSVTGGWVNAETGEPCDSDGNPLSTLDENGWRRE